MVKQTLAEKKILPPQVSKGQQTVSYLEIISVNDKRLKIEIKSDFYDFQSTATIKVWAGDAEGWIIVHSIPYQQMVTARGLCSSPSPGGVDSFRIDRRNLVQIALKVLF